MPQPKPKKQPSKKPKPKKLNLSTKSAWKNILKDIDKKEVPIHVLEKLVVTLDCGEQVTIDIKQIISEGADPDEIELHVNKRLKELDNYIHNVDFFVDIDQVQRTVQPITDKLLSKL